MLKKAMVNPIDLIAGFIIIISGIITITGRINLGVVLASIGLLIEGLKILIKSGP
jgi:hypothetical protein